MDRAEKAFFRRFIDRLLIVKTRHGEKNGPLFLGGEEKEKEKNIIEGLKRLATVAIYLRKQRSRTTRL